jgi:nucleoside-diphosphate-sugar epimerase
LALKDRQRPLQLIYTGSTSVCEGIEQQWVTEEMFLNPHAKNAQVLLETEQLYLNGNVNACVLRLGGIYGPNRDLTERASRLSGKVMPGTGSEPTNHIHLDDIVNAIEFSLNQHLTGVYHLVNDDHPTREALYGALCQQMDIPSPLWKSSTLSENKRKPMVSNQKIKDAGFVFKHPTLNFLQSCF